MLYCLELNVIHDLQFASTVLTRDRFKEPRTLCNQSLGLGLAWVRWTMLNRIDESFLHKFRPKRSKIYFEVPHTDFCWSLCRFILCNSVWFRLSRFETTKMTKRGQMSTNLSPLTSQSHKIRRLFVQSDEYLHFTFPIYEHDSRGNNHQTHNFPRHS